MQLLTWNYLIFHLGSKCNKLSLNINKTNYMHFQTAHLNPEFQYNVKIDDLSLEQKDSTTIFRGYH